MRCIEEFLLYNKGGTANQSPFVRIKGVFFIIKKCIFYYKKASGGWRTAAYNDGYASGRGGAEMSGHILYFALKCEKCVKT